MSEHTTEAVERVPAVTVLVHTGGLLTRYTYPGADLWDVGGDGELAIYRGAPGRDKFTSLADATLIALHAAGTWSAAQAESFTVVPPAALMQRIREQLETMANSGAAREMAESVVDAALADLRVYAGPHPA